MSAFKKLSNRFISRLVHCAFPCLTVSCNNYLTHNICRRLIYTQQQVYRQAGSKQLKIVQENDASAVIDNWSCRPDSLSDAIEYFSEDEVDPLESSVSQDVRQFIDKIAPALDLSFNLAAYADKSETIQQFIRLGVDLSRVERRIRNASLLLKLDFTNDVQPYLKFLHDHGVAAEKLGRFITINPRIFVKHLDDLQVRINYLEAKRFSKDNISTILTKNPRFINYPTKMVDGKLGALQKEYKLTGREVRQVVVGLPKIVNFVPMFFREMNFCFKEECGFTPEEVKQLLLTRPRLWLKNRKYLIVDFDYLHNEMKIPHELIVKFPATLNLTGRRYIKHRHLYLKKLKRDQYDPTKPGYVPLSAFCLLDKEFCQKYAKTCVEDYNQFLKTI